MSRKIIPESDEEDNEKEDEGQDSDSDDEEDDDGGRNGLDEEIKAACAKLQADWVSEGQGKVCLPSSPFFLHSDLEVVCLAMSKTQPSGAI